LKVCQALRSANITHLYTAKKAAKVVVAVVEVLITELAPKLTILEEKRG
jgi:hypothetical protein